MKKAPTNVMRPVPGFRCAGFSLIELMTAASVFFLLLLLVLGVTSQVNNLAARSGSQTLVRQSARAALGLMQKDIESAVLPLDAAAPDSVQFVLNPSFVSSACKNPDALFWHGMAGGDFGKGGVTAFGYFIKWKKERGRLHADLFRFQAAAADPGLFRLYEAPGAWVTDALLDGLLWPLSENVVALYVRCYRRELSGALEEVKDFDSRQEHALPVLVTVSLLTLDPRTLHRMDDADAITGLYGEASDARALQELLSPALRQASSVFENSFWLPASRP